VRFNAVRHGMLSMSPVVPTLEREEDWQEHREGIEASLAPTDHFESCLAERIALLLWRVRRVTAFKTETMIKAAAHVDKEWKREADARRQVAGNPAYEETLRNSLPQAEWMQQQQADLIIPKEETLERVMRYEAHLQRQLLQTMHELEALQARRKGEATPLARLDAST